MGAVSSKIWLSRVKAPGCLGTQPPFSDPFANWMLILVDIICCKDIVHKPCIALSLL